MQNYVNEEEYFKYLDIIGLSATIIGALRFIPLVAEVYRSKKTNNFTYGTLLFAFTSTILWIIYSFMRKSISDIFGTPSPTSSMRWTGPCPRRRPCWGSLAGVPLQPRRAQRGGLLEEDLA